MKMKVKVRNLSFILILLIMNGFSSENLINANETEITLKEIGEIDTNGSVMDVVVRNNIAFLADDINGFYIYDVSDPANPIELFHDASAGKANSIDIVGDLAFLAILFSGLKIYNISNLAAPVYLGSYEDSGAIVDIQVIDDIAYLSDHGSSSGDTAGIKLIDVTDPQNPFLIVNYRGGGKPSNLFVQNKTVFSADYVFGFEILSVSNLPSVHLLSKLERTSGFFGVYVENYYAYFTANSIIEKGLHIYDVKNNSDPTLMNIFPIEGNPCDLLVKDSIAFIADYENGLVMIDVSDPYSPIQLGNFSDGGKPFDVEIHGNIVYVADMDDGLEIIEIVGWGENNTDLVTNTINGYNVLFLSASFIPILFMIHYLKKRGEKSSLNI